MIVLRPRPARRRRRSTAFKRDINLVLARGVRRLFAIAQDEYRRTLDKHGVLDFSDVLERTLELLGQMEEFSRSRYRLESRYQHVLVDEFQDTSRAQWQLVRELVRAWSAGEGLSHGPIPPSIFIVGDRKQSIYGFRDAEVAVLDAAARVHRRAAARIAGARRDHAQLSLGARAADVRQRRRATAIEKAPDRPDAFRYRDDDAFPLRGGAPIGERRRVGVGRRPTRMRAQAEAVADEIARLLIDGRDGARSRHRRAAADWSRRHRRAVPHAREPQPVRGGAGAGAACRIYVYKGLGFFDADEIKDVLALRRLSRRSGIEPARRRVPAIALRAAVGRGAEAAGARPGDRADRRSARPRSTRCRTTIASGCCWRANRSARGSPPPIRCRRPSSSIACSPNPPTPSRSAGPASRRRART